MRKSILLLCLLALLLTSAAEPPPATSSVDQLQESPLLKGEHCFKNAPDHVLNELTSAGWANCESCIDGELTLYADHVRPLVDIRCSSVTLARENIHDAIVSFDRAFQTVTDGNWFGHESSRHAARVEWILITLASETERPIHAPRYTLDDLHSIVLMWYRAHRFLDQAEAQPASEKFAEIVDDAIKSLGRAEQQLTPDQAAHLRGMLMGRLAQRL